MVYDDYYSNKYAIREHVPPEDRQKLLAYIEESKSHTPKPNCFKSEQIKGKYTYEGPLLSESDR